MPRTARTVRAGVTYHVLNRGNARATVFHDATDYQAFLALAVESARRTATTVAAFCLMPNHFHFLLRPTSDDGLARWAHWLTTTHAHRHKRRYPLLAGHIWGGRFKAFPVQNDQYLAAVANYIETNAQRSGLVEHAEDWPWGSRAQVLAESARGLLDRTGLFTQVERGTEDVPATSSDVLNQIRHCISRGAPFGSPEWQETIAVELGLAHTLRRQGRPFGYKVPRPPTACATDPSQEEDSERN